MWVNRFPLRGDDLEILAASSTAPVRTRDFPGRDLKTLQRRLAHLRRLKLLTAQGGRRDRTHAAAIPELASAAAAAIHERNDLPDSMKGPAALAFLACLPDDNPSVSALHLSGLNRKTWSSLRKTFSRTNIVLRPPTGDTINPGLGGVHLLLSEYRRLFERIPPKVATPRMGPPSGAGMIQARGGLMVHQVIHQAGLETTWAIGGAEPGPDGVPVGPSSKQEPYQALATQRNIVYYGPRTLDRWDHAFLYCLSQPRYVTDSDHPDGKRLAGIDGRAKALLFAMMTPELAQHPLFLERARFYGLQNVIRIESQTVFSDPDHGLWSEIRSMRREHGVEEGYLAQQG